MPLPPPPPAVKAAPTRVPRKPPVMAPPPPSAPTHTAKTFTTGKWTGDTEGDKLIIYSGSGKGKTTLASMAPKPLFIGLDDGGRRIRNPKTGEAVDRIEDIETYQDVRDALQQPGLFANHETVVIDTGTALELLAMQHVIENVKHEKAGVKITGIEDFGYGKGYQHMFDAMRLIFQDLDGLVRQGKNVVVLCQECPVVVANTAGANFLQDGPKLYAPGPESKQAFTTRGFAVEWADHVLRIGFLGNQVVGAHTDREGKEHAGKVKGGTTRAIYAMPQDPSFFAKTRTLTEPVISFESPDDDSLWCLLFPE
jgi:hypothetical protein